MWFFTVRIAVAFQTTSKHGEHLQVETIKRFVPPA
jgi:hypothetical protein